MTIVFSRCTLINDYKSKIKLEQSNKDSPLISCFQQLLVLFDVDVPSHNTGCFCCYCLLLGTNSFFQNERNAKDKKRAKKSKREIIFVVLSFALIMAHRIGHSTNGTHRFCRPVRDAYEQTSHFSRANYQQRLFVRQNAWACFTCELVDPAGQF